MIWQCAHRPQHMLDVVGKQHVAAAPAPVRMGQHSAETGCRPANPLRRAYLHVGRSRPLRPAPKPGQKAEVDDMAVRIRRHLRQRRFILPAECQRTAQHDQPPRRPGIPGAAYDLPHKIIAHRRLNRQRPGVDHARVARGQQLTQRTPVERGSRVAVLRDRCAGESDPSRQPKVADFPCSVRSESLSAGITTDILRRRDPAEFGERSDGVIFTSSSTLRRGIRGLGTNRQPQQSLHPRAATRHRGYRPPAALPPGARPPTHRAADRSSRERHGGCGA